MDNENKDLQGSETEMTPEEKVQADISAKISEAAEPLKDEINEANQGEAALDDETVESGAADETAVLNEDGTPIESDEMIDVKPEPKKVTLNLSSFVTSTVAAVLVGALLMFAVYQMPAANKALPGGSQKAAMIEESDGSKVVATVNGEEITDYDVRYYIYSEASAYASANSISEDQIGDYDWDQEVDGKKLSDTIREKAVADAIGEVITLQKGAANNITLDETTANQIATQISTLKSTYGEDGLALRARTMGVSSVKQYEKMYKKVMTLQSVQQDIDKNADKYYPEDKSVLNDYKQDGKASVKHILIKTDSSSSGDENADAQPQEDKKAKAQEILDRIKNGEDFDALMKEFNEDTSETETGYTFTAGQMQPEFEAAAFALNLDEVSDLVQTTYGYHIIKRIPGMYELQAYWENDKDAKIKKKDSKIAKISVKDVMSDVKAATDQLTAEQAAQKSSGSSSSSSK